MDPKVWGLAVSFTTHVCGENDDKLVDRFHNTNWYTLPKLFSCFISDIFYSPLLPLNYTYKSSQSHKDWRNVS